MLLLRILTLPIAMVAFATLYIAATKAPAAVEMTSIILWIVFPIMLIAAAMKRLTRRQFKTQSI